MTRLATILVSLMGSLGIAVAAGYFILIFRAFQPGGAQVTEFLIGKSDGSFGWGFTIVLVPYVLLLAHMWFRIRLGDWMLARGALDDAAAYARRRMRPNPLRARKEALAHRVTLMRVHVRRGEYEEAWRLAEEVGKPGRPNPWLTRFRRWQLEVALRRENLVEARRVIEVTGTPRERSAEAAAFHCAAAEIAIREGDAAAARERLESARWAHAEPGTRDRVAEALRAATFEVEEEVLRDALSGLDLASKWLEEVPGAAGELVACRARILAKLAREEESRALLEQLPTHSDSRSEWVFQQARQEMCMSEFKGREIEDDAGLREVMQRAKTLAVVGMKKDGAANYVPRFMEQRGFKIIPVNPSYDTVDGKECVNNVTEAAGADMVVVFRRPEYVEDHAREILEMEPLPETVWMQLGIRNARASELLREAGIDVVQSRCLKIEYPRLIGA